MELKKIVIGIVVAGALIAGLVKGSEMKTIGTEKVIVETTRLGIMGSDKINNINVICENILNIKKGSEVEITTSKNFFGEIKRVVKK